MHSPSSCTGAAVSHACSDARSPAGTRARRELQGRELPGLCFLLSPQNSGLCVLPGLRRPLAPGGRAPLLPSATCSWRLPFGAILACPPAVSVLGQRCRHTGRYPEGMALSCCQEGTRWATVTWRGQAASCPRGAVPAGWGPAFSPCGVEPGAASRLLGGGVDPCVGEVLEQGHVHVGLRGNPSQEQDVTVSPFPLPPVPAAHGHGAGARRAAGGRCWGALGGVARGWRVGGPPMPRVHSPSGPPACG